VSWPGTVQFALGATATGVLEFTPFIRAASRGVAALPSYQTSPSDGAVGVA